MVSDYTCFNVNKVNHHGFTHKGDELVYFDNHRSVSVHRRSDWLSWKKYQCFTSKDGNVLALTLDRKFEGAFFSGVMDYADSLSDRSNITYKYIKSRSRNRRSVCRQIPTKA